MVQKKVPNKLGINDDRVKTEKGLLPKLKQSSSQQHDGKNRGGELKKKMKKSKSIKRLDLESFQSPPPPPPPGKPPQLCGGFLGGASSGGGFLVPKKQSPAKPAGGSSPPQTRKPPPPQPPVRQEPPPQPGKPPQQLCGGFPGSAVSGGSFLVPKKQSSVKSTEGSPNYMKSTSSFEARKEERSRSPISTSWSPQTSISPKTPSLKKPVNSKHNSSSSSKGSRSLSRTSSLKLVRTLTKSPSFKPSRSLSKRCSPVVLCEDFDAQKATCSSTLKDSKFPNYLTLTPGATEAEGTSAMKVCPYTYCSLNGHRHAPLPPLKCFLSARRRVLKTQKSFKLGCLSPRRTKPNGSDSKIFPITPIVQEEGGDFFVEIYAKDSEGSNEKVDTDFEKNQEMEVDETVVCLPSSVQEEVSRDCFVDKRDKEEEIKSSIQMDEGDFEGSDMDLEAGEYSKAYIEDVSNCYFKKLVPDEVMAVLFDERSVGSEAWFDDQDSESGCSSPNSESYGLEESTSKEERTWALIEEITEESKDTSGDSNVALNEEIPRMVEDEIKGACDIEDEELADHKENESAHDGGYSCLFLGNRESDSSQDFLDQEIPAVDAREEIEDNESPQEDGYSCLFLGNQESDSSQDSLDQELPAVDAREDVEEIESRQDDGDSCLFLGNQELDSCQDFLEQELPNDEARDEMKENESSQTSEEVDTSKQAFAHKVPDNETKDPSSTKQFQCKNVDENQEQDEAKKYELSMVEEESQEFDEAEDKFKSKRDEEEKISIPEEKTSEETKKRGLYKRSDLKEESLEEFKYPKWGARGKRMAEEPEEEREFNPREPNYLPVEPDEDAEKVDLRHQMVDERKNAEEWMVDFALRRAVTSLAPARKRKVALLVEAFETVMPTNSSLLMIYSRLRWKTRRRNGENKLISGSAQTTKRVVFVIIYVICVCFKDLISLTNLCITDNSKKKKRKEKKRKEKSVGVLVSWRGTSLHLYSLLLYLLQVFYNYLMLIYGFYFNVSSIEICLSKLLRSIR